MSTGRMCAVAGVWVLIALALASPRADAAIGRATLDASEIDKSLIATPGTLPLDVAVDDRHVYWSWADTDGGPPFGIGRADLDGTGIERTFIHDTGYGGLAVSASHLYWADANRRTLGRANLDGTGIDRQFISSAGERPFDVEVSDAHVYWAWDNGTAFPTLGWIGNATLNGDQADPDLIGPISLGSNRALALDAQHVYWGAGGDVLRANLDGTGAPSCPSPIEPCTPAFLPTLAYDLAADAAHVYFSGAWVAGNELATGIGLANLDGSGFDPFGFWTESSPTGSAGPVNLAVDARHIYWTSSGAGGDPDEAAPQTSITKRPHRRLEKRRATFKFAANESDATFECKLDQRAYRSCSSPRTYKRLSKGRHRFSVRATDAAGNRDPSPATDRFKVVG
jgi:virginiamycin B lyase